MQRASQSSSLSSSKLWLCLGSMVGVGDGGLWWLVADGGLWWVWVEVVVCGGWVEVIVYGCVVGGLRWWFIWVVC